VLSILATIAKQERLRLSERVRAGLERAMAKGTKSGKPVGRPRVICRRDEVVRLRDEQGYSWNRIKREMGISIGTARRVYLAAKREWRNEAATT
jgi:putative DNA-invertase from lambdoid prophage Rac